MKIAFAKKGGLWVKIKLFFGKVLLLALVFIGKVCFLFGYFVGKVYWGMLEKGENIMAGSKLMHREPAIFFHFTPISTSAN